MVFLRARVGHYDSLLPKPNSSAEAGGSVAVPSPPIVPSGGVMPRPGSLSGSMGADVPVRLAPSRAELLRVRDAAFRRVPERVAVFLRAPVERLVVFLRPPERDAVFLRAPVERDVVFFRPVERELVFLRPVERLVVFLRPPERDAVFLRAPVERLVVFLRPVERDVVFLRPVERDAVFFRAPVDRVAVLRRAVDLRVVPLERVLEAFLRALAIRAPPR